jgi:hypothetical protein
MSPSQQLHCDVQFTAEDSPEKSKSSSIATARGFLFVRFAADLACWAAFKTGHSVDSRQQGLSDESRLIPSSDSSSSSMMICGLTPPNTISSRFASAATVVGHPAEFLQHEGEPARVQADLGSS